MKPSSVMASAFAALVVVSPTTANASARPPAAMIAIPAGSYRPLFPAAPDKTSVAVAAFRIARVPVTNADFLRFVREHGEWSRERIAPVFAEAGYLAHWAGPQLLGDRTEPEQPVVNVSWFAARAYCTARGARLPSEAEWERVAAASRSAPDGEGDAAWRAELLASYSRPAPARLPRVGGTANFWGVSDLHGVVWEWVQDFSAAAAALAGNSDRMRFCGASGASARDPTDFVAFERLALRSSLRANFVLKSVGFRCAADAKP
jgi:formylglycine-generating enzyme